jgi:outer membrane protein X
MKRTATMLAVLATLAAAPSARAQAPNYQPVRVELTVFGAYASADATSWGGGAALEPKFNVTDQLAVGFRLEGSGMITQKVNVGATGSEAEVSQGARAVTAMLAKADWYLTTSPTRPFVGLGLGYYKIGAGSQEISGGGSVVQSAAAFKGFGFCPQIGVNFGAFRMSALYHVVLGGDMVVATQAVGAPAPTEVKLAKNFFAFELGGTIGGARRAPVAFPAPGAQ